MSNPQPVPAETEARQVEALAPVPAKTPVRMGVAPTNLDEGWRLAQMLAQSELVPKGYRGKPADVLAAIQYGMEVGLPPMASLHSVYVTNGRPSMWGEGLLGVIMASPLYRDHEEYFLLSGNKQVDVLTADDLKNDATTAVTTFWRRDSPRPRTASFSVAQAKKAGLLGKEGPWQTYPDRMLKMRARGFAARDAFPDLIRGIRTVEEARDMPADDNGIDLQPVQPRRASATKVAEVETFVARGQAAQAAVDQVIREQTVGAGELVTLDNVLVKHTAFIKPTTAGVEPYFLITVIRTETRAPLDLITRDEPTYKEASAREGTDDRLRIEYVAQADAGATARVITRIDPLDPVPPADLLS